MSAERAARMDRLLDFLAAVRRFMEAEYVHAKAISDHNDAGGAPMAHTHSRDDVDLAHADLMNFPAVMADLVALEIGKVAESRAALHEARALFDTISATRRRYGAIATHAQTMGWKISAIIGDRP